LLSFIFEAAYSFALPVLEFHLLFALVSYVLVTSPNSPGTDHILNKIFTSLYGWIAILISFFLATVCVIREVSLLPDVG